MKNIAALLMAASVIAAGGCREAKSPPSPAETKKYPPPPVEYAVGRIEVNDEAAEPSVHINVAVDPATSAQDIERLLNYFDKERYADYDIVWVNVFFDPVKARGMAAPPDAVAATLRINRPNFRELKLSDTLVGDSLDATQPEVTSQTEEVIYLGRRGRMFDSTKQAQALVDLMEEKPGAAIYKITWQAPDNMTLTYSVEQKMLVRVREGVCRETWSDMTFEDIKRAARGAGFGGRSRHGSDYSYILEKGDGEAPGEEE